MTAAALLQQLEALPHDDRIRRMIRLGQEAGTDAEAVLRQLGQGDWYERYLGLWSAFGHRDAKAALEACRGSSQSLQRLGRQLVALAGTDEEVVQALESTPAKQLAKFLGVLRRRKRIAAIDRFLDALAAAQPDRTAVLLPLGSDALIRQHRAAGEEMGGSLWWSRLARHHPSLAAEFWLSLSAHASPPDLHLLRVAEAILPVLGRRFPDDALRLLPEVARHGKPSPAALYPLMRRRAAAVVRWVLTQEDPPAASLSAIAHRLPEDLLLEALGRVPQLFPQPETFLPRLAARLRGKVFAAAGTAWRAADGTIPPQLLKLLPREVREAEARRHLGLPALADQPTQRVAYTGLLPWEEARAAADPLLKHPEGEMRAAAIAALVRAGRHDRDRVTEILGLLRQRANEQDPVRLAFAEALSELPPSRWTAEQQTTLEQVIQDGLDARDLSWGTSRYFQTLLVRAVAFRPEWALRALVRLMGNRGGFALMPLEPRWSDAHVRQLEPLLRELVEDWLGRRGEHLVLALAAALGRRLRASPFLLDTLERIARSTHKDLPSPAALGLLEKHDKPRFVRLALEFLKKDESWITQPMVWGYLHRHRQDLLTPFLPPRAYRGRFNTQGALWVLPVTSGCHRWTAKQQHIFAKGLDDILRKDLRLPNPHKIWVLNQLAALPGVPAKTVVQLTGDTRPVVRDVALQVLGRLDDLSQVVPALVDCLQDDRARVAIYALRRAVLQMQPAPAVDLLRNAPLDKVTVAKEVFRLLGEVPGDAAFGLLLDAADKPLHRDIRIALLRALWDHLERDATWPLLEQAAREPEAGPASSLIRIPDDRLSPKARGRLLALFARLLEHPDPSIRVALLRRLAELPIRDPGRQLLPLLCARLESTAPNERVAAASAVMGMVVPADAQAVAALFARRAANRRALVAALEALRQSLRTNPTRYRPVGQAVLRALDPDPMTMTWCVRLALHSLPWEQWVSWWESHTGILAGDPFTVAVEEIPQVSPAHLPTPQLQACVNHLASAQEPTLRRLAVTALVTLASRPPGWATPRLELLKRLRKDPSPMVAGAAQFTLPEEEGTDRIEAG